MTQRRKFGAFRWICLCLALAGIYLFWRSYSLPVEGYLAFHGRDLGFVAEAGGLRLFQNRIAYRAPAATDPAYAVHPMDFRFKDFDMDGYDRQSWTPGPTQFSWHGFGYMRPTVWSTDETLIIVYTYSDFHMPLAGAIGTLLLPVAVWLIRGLWRREPEGNPCRACGYDLRGHEAGAIRCPECGADQKPPVAIARRPPLKIVNKIMLTADALLLAGTVYLVATSGHYERDLFLDRNWRVHLIASPGGEITLRYEPAEPGKQHDYPLPLPVTGMHPSPLWFWVRLESALPSPYQPRPTGFAIGKEPLGITIAPAPKEDAGRFARFISMPAWSALGLLAIYPATAAIGMIRRRANKRASPPGAPSGLAPR